MVKIVVKRNACSALTGERKAIRAISSAKESFAYRETKAANIPVTYVSKGFIVREHNGKVETIGKVAPKVKVIETR